MAAALVALIAYRSNGKRTLEFEVTPSINNPSGGIQLVYCASCRHGAFMFYARTPGMLQGLTFSMLKPESMDWAGV